MSDLDQKTLQRLADQIQSLCAEMREAEASLLSSLPALHQVHGPSARNLAHYMALRRHDIRELQSALAQLGLSSLGRTESHVLGSFETVLRLLNILLGKKPMLAPPDPAVDIEDGASLLENNTEALLGVCPPGRKVRIMVTMSTESAYDYGLVRDLLQSGMDCMRINCSHDGPEVWLGMIANLQRAKEETGRPCRVAMDLAGPKLRTCAIEPGPAVLKCRPQRDTFDQVVEPVRLWLTCAEAVPGAKPAGVTIPVSRRFLVGLRAGDVIRFRDARGAQRSLRVLDPKGESCLCQMNRTAYFVPGLQLSVVAGGEAAGEQAKRWRAGRIGALPRRQQALTLMEGDTLIVLRSSEPGRPAMRDGRGRVIAPAQIGVSIPEFLEHAKPGEPIWFDDGKIGGVIRSVDPQAVHVEITQARVEGQKLAAQKGINLPDTRIDSPALTPADLETLKFVVQHADIVGYSFVRTESDVHELLAQLATLGGESIGVILKIETQKAFENLPKLILAAMGTRAVGAMIARGDLAVECGYQRLAEIQEEILWVCEAGHVPVIWATQVLESLAKRGVPSRSEITDAAMGERAECVMLNKGPHAVKAVRVLDDILHRMQDHQAKKRSLLRRLSLASTFAARV